MLYTPPQKMSRAENESEGERKEFLTHPGPAESTQRSNIYPRPHVLNGRLHDVYSEQMVTFNAIFAIIMLAQLLLLYLYIEYDINSNPFASTFLNLSSLCAVLASLLLLLRYYCQEQEYELINDFSEELWIVIIKAIAVLLSPYKFLEESILQLRSIHSDGSIDELKLNHLLAIFTYFKAACFAGMLLTCSKYMNPRASRITRLYRSTSGVLFALKSIFKDSPFCFIITVSMFSVWLFTFSFRVSEASIYSASSAGTIYCNMAWMTMVTMTTVGYGDYMPQTTIGRVIGALCGIWGAFIVSVMVVVLTSALSLDRKESKALRVINKLNHQAHLKQVAGQVLRKTLWRLWINRKYRLAKRPLLPERKLFQQFRQLRQAQRSLSLGQGQMQFYNEFFKRIQGACSSVSKLTSNNLKLVNLLTEEYIFKPELNKKLQYLPKIRIKQRRKK